MPKTAKGKTIWSSIRKSRKYRTLRKKKSVFYAMANSGKYGKLHR